MGTGRGKAKWSVAVMLTLGLVGAACGGSSENAEKSSSSGSGSSGGGTLVVGTVEKPSSIDPANVYEKFASDVLFNTTNRLVEFNPGSTEPDPGLATAWTISDDGLTYTFTLRKGVKFSDGSDFDSEDVKYSLERSINVNDPDGASFLLQSRDDAGKVTSGIKTIETPSPTQLVITLVAPNTTFLTRLNYTVASIVPSDGAYKSPTKPLTGDVSGQLAKWENTKTVVGTGPYMLKSYKPGESMVLVRNDKYWGPKAKTKGVNIRFYDKAAQLKNALDAGEIDLNVNDLGPAERSALGKSVTTFKGQGARIRYLVIDVKKAPFNNPKVRQAIAASIDRDKIVTDVFEGGAQPAFSMIPSAFDKVTKDYISDVKADLPTGQKIKFDLWYPLNKYGDTESSMAEVVARSLNESGLFDVTTKSADWESEYADNTGVGSPYGIYTLGWYPDYFDADDYIDPFYSSTGFLGHYVDKNMDALVKKEQSQTDASARDATFDDIQKKGAADMPFIPLYTEASFAYYGKNLKNVQSTMDIVQQVRWFVISKDG
jgi:peptide/nickel transport system substrate-binding protein